MHANVTFATEIIDVQENINTGLNRLIDIVARIDGELDFKPSDYQTISLIPPIVLILQLIEMTLSSVGNIVGIFQSANVPFDPYYFLEKYVPYIDWDDFKKASEEHLRVIKIKAEADALNQPPLEDSSGFGNSNRGAY